jgi:hypothetical protein
MSILPCVGHRSLMAECASISRGYGYLMTTVLAVFAVSLLLSLALTPVAATLGRWGEAMDRPDGARKLHAKSTPRTGGIALFDPARIEWTSS